MIISPYSGKRMHWTPFGVGTSQRLTDHFTLINRPNLVARPMVSIFVLLDSYMNCN